MSVEFVLTSSYVSASDPRNDCTWIAGKVPKRVHAQTTGISIISPVSAFVVHVHRLRNDVTRTMHSRLCTYRYVILFSAGIHFVVERRTMCNINHRTIFIPRLKRGQSIYMFSVREKTYKDKRESSLSYFVVLSFDVTQIDQTVLRRN